MDQNHNASLLPGPEDLERNHQRKYGDPVRTGPSARMRHRFRYFTPEDHYEALADKLVGPETVWLDAGCGRMIFPSNRKLSEELSKRCALLVGVDPDDTLDENPYVHEKVKALVDDYETDRRFDLITLRMVAEHVADPDRFVTSLARLTKPGGRVVVYTVFKWSPVPLLTDLVPFGLHHPIKKLVWGSESKDTFPVANKMNTRGALRSVFDRHGFEESGFLYADDCRTFAGNRVLHWVELTFHRAFRAVGLHYPEVCLIGVYTRLPA